MKTKLVTIDEHCGQPQGSFKNYIKKQDGLIYKQEQDRKERIRKHKHR